MNRKLKQYEIGSYMGTNQYLGDCPKNEWKWDSRTSIFKCICGKIYTASLSKVRNGCSNSCGCITKAKTHGMSKTRHYAIWQSMKRRCDSPSCEFFYAYGEKGIGYCDKWKTFEGFWEDMKGGYNDELELDRIDPNGNYCKENCRWVNEGLQSYNRCINKSNTTGKVGVYFDKNTNKWQARIGKNGNNHYLGSFDTFETACAVRDKAEIECYGFNVNKLKRGE